MRDAVAEFLAAYRRRGGDVPFQQLYAELPDAPMAPMERLVGADAEARRLAGLPCTVERWLGSLPAGQSRGEAVDACVAAELTEADEAGRFAESCRRIAQMGEEFAAAVTRVRLVHDLLEMSDDTEAPLSSEWPQPPCEFGPPFGTFEHRFRLHSVIGTGASSTVYEATDRRFSEAGYEHRVVVKLLPPELAPRATLEAIRGRRVDHPGVLRWLDAGESPEGWGYVVSELFPSRPLSDPATLRQLGRRGAIDALRQVAEAVQAAHAAGVLHLDIKPANILVDDKGRARLCDFGAAIPTASARQGTQETTPLFAAPELLGGGSPGTSADIYALGAVLRWCMEELEALGAEAAEPADAARLAAVWARAMSPAPGNRYAAARDFAADLAAWLERRPLSTEPESLLLSLRLSFRRAPWRWAGSAAAAVAALTLIALAVQARIDRADEHAAALAKDLEQAKRQAALGEYISHVEVLGQSNARAAYPQLIALHWLLSARGVQSSELMTKTDQAQRGVWRRQLELARSHGEMDHLEPRLIEVCLAVTELRLADQGDGMALVNAQAAVDSSLPWWRDHAQPDDPWRQAVEAIAAITRCRLVIGPDKPDATERAALTQQLTQAREQLSENAPALSKMANDCLTELARPRRPGSRPTPPGTEARAP